ncbi:hypothetical protein [Caulobacter sp. UC70_42]|uniref:hypothetical protein n=1 Tax=Caulobacter sp. UC70_42 TaxID=3374551 RepID=UPI00375673DF
MREAILAVNERIATQHAARLAITVPKGSPYRGHIVSSIRVKTGANGFEKVISIGSEAFPYAAPLEFGHRNKDGSRTPPTKFFFPLVRIMRRKYRAALIRAVRQVLRGK